MRRKTAAELRMVGDPRGAKRRDSPMGRPGEPDRETWLPDASPEVAAVWDELVETMPAGTLTEADGPALALLADAVADWRSLLVECDEHGYLCEGSKGTPTLHPRWRAKRSASERMLAMLREFGLTPCSRAKVTKASDHVALAKDGYGGEFFGEGSRARARASGERFFEGGGNA